MTFMCLFLVLNWGFGEGEQLQQICPCSDRETTVFTATVMGSQQCDDE